MEKQYQPILLTTPEPAPPEKLKALPGAIFPL